MSAYPRPPVDLAVLLLLAALVLTAGLGLKQPWAPDEPRYALVARDMVETGEWLIPYRAGQPYSDKPPLFFWLVGAAYAATGSLRVAHQLPSALAGLATLLLVWDLARRLWGRRAAWWSGLALLAIVQLPLQAKSGQIDAVLALWTTLGLYGLLRHLLTGPAWGWYAVGGAACGLGVLTKGVGFLPWLVLIPWTLARRREWLGPVGPGGWRWATGPLLTLAVPLAWLAPMVLATSGSEELLAYRSDLLWQQTAERYVAPTAHLKPPWYFAAEVIPALWLPITVFLPWLVPTWFRRLRRRDPTSLLLLGWVVLVVAFFSLSPGKRGVYVLPAVPAIALATGAVAPALKRLRAIRTAGFAFSVVVSMLLAALGMSAALGAGWAAHVRADYGIGAALPLLAASSAGLLAAALCRPRRGLAATGMLLLALWLVHGWWIVPTLDPVRSAEPFMARVESAVSDDQVLAMAGWKEQMVLHARRPLVHFGYHTPPHVQQRSGAAWLLGGDGRRLLLPVGWLEPCFEATAGVDVGLQSRTYWRLVAAKDVRPGACQAGPTAEAFAYVPPAGSRPRRSALQ